jgi:hypothetical protein
MNRQSSNALAVTKLNNEAATLIQEKNYAKACGILSVALGAAERLIKTRFDCCDVSLSTSESSSNRSTCCFLSDTTAADSTTGGYFFYRPPVHVFVSNHFTVPAIHNLAYAIIYNLALCHHLQAVLITNGSLPQSPDRHFQEAIVLYKQAEKLMNHGSLGVLHSVVIANNMGHAYHCLSDELYANCCFYRLLKAFAQLRESMLVDPEAAGELQKGITDGFLSNILSILAISLVAAAA